MGDAKAMNAASDTGVAGKFVQYGDHIDTIETVQMVFHEQRKLSFTYGAVFFAVTLAIPALSVWFEPWYASQLMGGFTGNYFVVAIAYFVFLWLMAWTYSKQADKLDERLMHIADEVEAEFKGGDE